MSRLFSQNVPTSVRALERSLLVDEATGNLQSVAWGPELGAILAEFMAAVERVMAGVAFMDGLFSLGFGAELSGFNAELRALDEHTVV